MFQFLDFYLSRHNKFYQKNINRNKFFIAIPFGTIIYFIFALIFDNGPFLPPFSNKFSSVDCDFIRIENVSGNDGWINIYFSSDYIIEYPQEYLPHFLNLKVRSHNISCNYANTDIKNMSKSNNIFRISIHHPFYGETNINLSCLKKPLGMTSLNLSEINDNGNNSEYGAIIYPYSDFLRLKNVGIKENNIMLFSNISTSQNELHYDSIKINVSLAKWTKSHFLKYYNLSYSDNIALILNQPDTIKWKTILFFLLPIAKSLETMHITDKRKIKFLLPSLKGKINFHEMLKHFSSDSPILIPFNATFYEYLNIPATTTSVSLSDNNAISKALNSNFSYLRSKFVTKNPEPNLITLSHDLWDYKDIVQEACTSCKISQLFPGNDINSIATLVGQSRILIGNHFSQLINSIWLTPNYTAVINAEEPLLRCNEYLESLTKNHSIKYYSMYPKPEEKTCKCMDFSCYPEKIEKKRIDGNLLKSIVRKVVLDMHLE